MSIQAMVWVIEHSQSRLADRCVMFSIANHTDREGRNAWPSTQTISHEARISKRQVQISTARLVEDGELAIGKNLGPRGTNLYSLPLMTQGSPTLLAGGPEGTCRGAESAGVQNLRGEKPAPGAKFPAAKGRNSAPEPFFEPSLEPSQTTAVAPPPLTGPSEANREDERSPMSAGSPSPSSPTPQSRQPEIVSPGAAAKAANCRTVKPIPLIRQISDALARMFAEEFQDTPAWGPADYAQLAKTLTRHPMSVEQICARYANMLHSPDRFHNSKGGSLLYFATHIDEFLRPVPVYGGGNGKLYGSALHDANMRAGAEALRRAEERSRQATPDVCGSSGSDREPGTN